MASMTLTVSGRGTDNATDIPIVKLNNGISVPMYGLGLSHNGGWTDSSVIESIRMGIRLFDTAKRYGNEELLGNIIVKACRGALDDVPQLQRENFVLSSKFWPGDLGLYSSVAEDIRTAAIASCKRLKVTYLDVYLLHWPGRWRTGVYPDLSPSELRQQMWAAMESLVEEGLVRTIGVSNFEVHHLKDILISCTIVPAINQFELNPFLQNRAIRELCKVHSIQVEGYCPLAKGHGLHHVVVQRIAATAGITPAQLLIRYSLETGSITIPKTTCVEHARQNFKALSLKLSGTQMKQLHELECNLRSTWDPTHVA